MRKRITGWLLLCILILSTAVLPITALGEEGAARSFHEGPDTYQYAEVATEKGTLNMREKAKDKAKVTAKLPRGTIVRVVEEMEEELDEGWTKILYKDTAGYVKTSFLKIIDELPYTAITKESGGDAIIAFKRLLYKLEYIKSDEINQKFDAVMETALTKLQLMNDVQLNPTVVTPELQALIEWGRIVKAKSGYLDTATDPDTGLTVSIYCWDSDGILYEDDQAVKLKISYGVQATGGQGPYQITVKKSLGGGGAEFADEVTNPFSHIWGQDTERVYVYAVVVDAAGNTVTACAPFRYNLPERYKDKG